MALREGISTIAVFSVLIGLFAFAANDWRLPWTHDQALGEEYCEAHRVPLAKCESCNIRLARGGTFTIKEREPKEGECPNLVVRITLAPEAARSVDLKLHTAEQQPVAEVIAANAETQYPTSHYARVTPRIAGVIREVKASLGQKVVAGEALATMESTDFAEAKSEHLHALALLHLREQSFDQEKQLADKELTTKRKLLEAKTELEEARLALDQTRQRLRLLGMGAEQTEQLAVTRDVSPLLEILAPFAGTVVEVAAVPGDSVATDRHVFSVAAMERLWLTIDVYEIDLPKIEKDQRVTFRVDALPGQKFVGKVFAIGSQIDDRTRTARVYADVKNAQELLRVGMFGRAEISVKPAEPKLLVPKAAVQNDGDCNLVFVSPLPNVFQARKINVGTVYDRGYEVLGGLAAGEKVVTTGSFLLKTEVLRGQIGAG